MSFLIDIAKGIPKQRELIYKTNDIFHTYNKCPKDDLSIISLDMYYKSFGNLDIENVNHYEFEELIEKILNAKKDINKASEPIPDHADTIYAKIKYPLTNTAYIKITPKSNDIITYGMLLYAYTLAYQHVYDIEESDIGEKPKNISVSGEQPDVGAKSTSGFMMLNREKTNGRFGIWGHSIGDLIYNGISSIKIYKRPNQNTNFVLCEFHCDS